MLQDKTKPRKKREDSIEIRSAQIKGRAQVVERQEFEKVQNSVKNIDQKTCLNRDDHKHGRNALEPVL
jgi:hypothetical protein